MSFSTLFKLLMLEYAKVKFVLLVDFFFQEIYSTMIDDSSTSFITFLILTWYKLCEYY